MKKIACIILLTAFAGILASFKTADSATVAWGSTTHDFGKITQSKPVTHTFSFTNTGDEPLVIASVQASCGCTVASFSKEAVAPGAKGFVKATYNAAVAGPFTKTVTVTANTAEGTILLTLKGEVVAAQTK